YHNLLSNSQSEQELRTSIPSGQTAIERNGSDGNAEQRDPKSCLEDLGNQVTKWVKAMYGEKDDFTKDQRHVDASETKVERAGAARGSGSAFGLCKSDGLGENLHEGELHSDSDDCEHECGLKDPEGDQHSLEPWLSVVDSWG
ncbi:MAG: hypothetical protein Q9180_004630, partial [Flavoplaca navasiana]